LATFAPKCISWQAASRAVSALKIDPEVAADLREQTIALIASPAATDYVAE